MLKDLMEGKLAKYHVVYDVNRQPVAVFASAAHAGFFDEALNGGLVGCKDACCDMYHGVDVDAWEGEDPEC